MGNVVWKIELDNNYIDEYDTRKGILETAAFDILSMFHTTNKKIWPVIIWGRYDFII